MNIKRVTATEFLAKSQAPEDIVIDLRTNAEVASECLENCTNLPVQELDHAVLERLLSNKSQPHGDIYLLCQTGRRADMAVDKLKGQSERNFVIIEGGLTALKAAGASVKTGDKKVVSLERQVRIVAGALTLAGVLLGYFVNANLFVIAGGVGAGLLFSGITDTCGMAMLLAKMPWNTLKAK